MAKRFNAAAFLDKHGPFLMDGPIWRKLDREKRVKIARVIGQRKGRKFVRRKGRKLTAADKRQSARWASQGRNPDDGSRTRGRKATIVWTSSEGWKKGSMHRALGVPKGRRIPTSKLLRVFQDRPGSVVGKRARMLLNLRGIKTRSF